MIKNIYWIIWILFLYLAVSLFINISTDNKMYKSNPLVESIFANITFDGQDENTWYNSDNKYAKVSVSPNAIPAPVAIVVVSRHSH